MYGEKKREKEISKNLYATSTLVLKKQQWSTMNYASTNT